MSILAPSMPDYQVKTTSLWDMNSYAHTYLLVFLKFEDSISDSVFSWEIIL